VYPNQPAQPQFHPIFPMAKKKRKLTSIYPVQQYNQIQPLFFNIVILPIPISSITMSFIGKMRDLGFSKSVSIHPNQAMFPVLIPSIEGLIKEKYNCVQTTLTDNFDIVKTHGNKILKKLCTSIEIDQQIYHNTFASKGAPWYTTIDHVNVVLVRIKLASALMLKDTKLIKQLPTVETLFDEDLITEHEYNEIYSLHAKKMETKEYSKVQCCNLKCNNIVGYTKDEFPMTVLCVECWTLEQTKIKKANEIDDQKDSKTERDEDSN